MSVNIRVAQWKPVLGLFLVSQLSFGLVACSDNQADIEEATSTDRPVITSQSTVKPPSGNQMSTMDVKDKQLMDSQPVKESVALAKEIPSDGEMVKSVASGIASKIVKMRSGSEVYAMCVGCHGAVGEGGVGPRLSHLSEEQIVKDLQLYKSGKEKGPMSAMMIPNAQQLPDAEITAVAEYIQTLK